MPEQPYTAGDVPLEVGGPVQDIVAGDEHTCALLTTGKVRCWGNGASGKLGYGNVNVIGDNELPSTAGDVSVGGTVLQLAAGGSTTCVLLDTGNVRCWGSNSSGQLGYNLPTNVAIGDNETPASAGDVNTGGSVLQVTVGLTHSCALLSAGGIKCWGSNGSGELGLGNTTTLLAPAGTVNLSGSTAFQVTAGGNHTCALLGTGKARCWGSNGSGELGYGNTNNIGDNELPSTAGDINVLPPTP